MHATRPKVFTIAEFEYRPIYWVNILLTLLYSNVLSFTFSSHIVDFINTLLILVINKKFCLKYHRKILKSTLCYKIIANE